MKSIVVFCGSSSGSNGVYVETAKEVGKYFADKGIQLVYGGGNVGLMGEIADAALENGGIVVGVIPDFLRNWEVCHEGLSKLIVVKSMYERKVEMAKISDGVLVMPGAYGTLDELFEMLTLVQLGQDTQAIGILNVNGFYDHLISHIELMYREGFLRKIHKDLIHVANNIEDLIEKMDSFVAPKTPYKKWDK